MSANVGRNPDQKQPTRKIRDLPGCIKYIILLFLLLLLFAEYYAGEFRGFPKVSQIVWLIFLFKLFLILLLLILIWVQRQLFCEITSPIGCAIKEYDPVLHKWIIRVIGTASGAAFGSYTLNVTLGGSPTTIAVIYPAGGATGTVPVTNDELGRLDVTGVDPDAYKVTLTVSPAGWGSACTTFQEFTILLKTVSITSIGAVTAQIIGLHPDDATEVLKECKPVADPPLPATPGPEASIGEGVSVWGTADYFGCGRQMIEYVLQYKELLVAHPHTWRWADAGPWTDINLPLPFGDANHPRVYDSFYGTIDNTVQMPNYLTRQWSHDNILQFIDITTPPYLFYDLKWVTDPLGWSTGTITNPLSLNGRYTVRLRVRHNVIIGPPDPTPGELYDASTVWIDNRPIEGRITGMGVTGGISFGNCDELSLSSFITPSPLGSPPPPGPFTRHNADVNGRAWDPVILDSYVDTTVTPNTTIKPNDNFGHYSMDFKKNGSTVYLPMGLTAAQSATRVPSVLQQAPLTPLIEPLPPIPPDTGQLVSWDIVGALDAGPRGGAVGDAPYPKIYRGERCSYEIFLQVWDTTSLGDGGSVHYTWHTWPFCIMNDIPDATLPNASAANPWP